MLYINTFIVWIINIYINNTVVVLVKLVVSVHRGNLEKETQRSQPQETTLFFWEVTQELVVVVPGMWENEKHRNRGGFFYYHLSLFVFLIVVTLVRQNINILKTCIFLMLKNFEYV